MQIIRVYFFCHKSFWVFFAWLEMNMPKKKSKLFEYTHIMNKNNVVLEIECNLNEGHSIVLSRTNPFESKEQ